MEDSIFASVPYNLASNGVVERYNKTLCKRVQCMLSTANLPYTFWGEALPIAMQINNRSPHKSLKVAYRRRFGLTNPPRMIICSFSAVKLLCTLDKN